MKKLLHNARFWNTQSGSKKRLKINDYEEMFKKKHKNLDFALYDAYAGNSLQQVLRKITKNYKFVSPNKFLYKEKVNYKRKIHYIRAWFLVYGENNDEELLGYSFLSVDYRREKNPKTIKQWVEYLESPLCRKGLKDGVLATISSSHDRQWFIRDLFAWGSADEIATNYNPISFVRRNKKNKKRQKDEQKKYRRGHRNTKKR